MKQGITTPSLSNDATQYTLGGSKAYGDALFSVGIIGQNAPQLPDSDHILLPTLHSFIYDADFYVTNPSITQSLEFDIAMSLNGAGMTWGTQCNYLGDNNWDIWDNVNQHWVSTGVPCEFVKGWNHVTLHLQRGTNNVLLYQSIELNGSVHTLNKSYPPGTVPSYWFGLAANFQMDGNDTQSPNIAYIDNLNVTYE